MLDYNNVFSQEFRDEQARMAMGWRTTLAAKDKAGEYIGMMDRIEKAPPEQRVKLVEEFYTKLAKDAKMPQPKIRMVDFGAPGGPGKLAGGMSTGQDVWMDINAYTGKKIFWESEIGYFFHEQGHEWTRKLIAEKADKEYLEKYAKDVGRLKHAQQNYMHPGISNKYYRYDYTELHAQQVQPQGCGLYEDWENYRKGKKQ